MTIIGGILGYRKPQSDTVHLGKIVKVYSVVVGEVIFKVEPLAGGTEEDVKWEDVCKDKDEVFEAVKQSKK